MERLDPSDGPRLLALAGELVSATTWMADANEVVAPRLGLPVLTLVDWPDGDAEPEHGVQSKTVSLTRWRQDDRSSAAHHAQRAMLHRVDPFLGLTGADLAVVRHWLGQPDEGG